MDTITMDTVTMDTATMDTPSEDDRMAELGRYLVYIIPALSAIVIPFSLFNIFLLVIEEATRRSSHFLYLNLLLADTLTGLGGFFLAAHIKNHDKMPVWWFNNTIWLSFYTGVPLLFGLVLLRVLARHMNPSTWLSYGLTTSRVIVAVSWAIGFGVTILHDSISFGKIGSLVKDVLIIMVVLPTCIMNFTVWLSLRSLTGNYRQASKTALMLFVNFLLCYAYFTSCYVFYIYTFITGKTTCSTATWAGLLFCTDQGRHFVGEGSMLLQSIGNNVILVVTSWDLVQDLVNYCLRRRAGPERQPLIV